MTLRLRLAVAVGALLAVGLGVFGVATYSLYARGQYQQLDEQLRTSVQPTAGLLSRTDQMNRFEPYIPGFGSNRPTGNGSTGNDGSGRSGSRPNSGPPLALDTFAELRETDGTVVATKSLQSSDSQPELPADLGANLGFSTAGSTDGTQWRLLVAAVAPEGGASDRVVVVAAPMSDVRSALDRLVLIEVVAAASLLTLLVLGSWLILRRGLLPLEHMATSAESISAGDLSQRVTPADGRTEVGNLGLALNTMLDEIEVAFQEREATEQRLRQFLADASHELRTPLTSIQGFTELYRMGAAAPGGATAPGIDLDVMMRRIEGESARMKVLVEDLLLLARLDQTRPPERTRVDLGVLCADACTDVAAVAPDRRITLEAPEPVAVMGDEAHLRQALANLVANAVKHTEPGTAIDVRARLVDDEAEITVRDHGAGLSDDGLAHAFDRFWQADAARVGHGAGLGLAIVAAIATEHGGTARVENHPEGGAAFTIRLPLLSPA